MIHALRPLVAVSLLTLPTLARAEAAMPDVTLVGHTTAISSVAFSPDGKFLATADDGGTMKLWDVAAKKELATVDHLANPGGQVRFTPDGKTVIALGNTELAVLDVATAKRKPPVAVADLPGGPTAFDISPDGKWAAVVGRSSLRIYDLSTGTVKYAWDVHTNYGIRAVAFSPDSAHVATASTDHTALVVEASTGKIPATLQLKLNGVAVAFTHDGKRLLTYAEDGSLRSFDATTDGAAEDAKVLLDRGRVRTMAVSTDGKSVVVGGPGRGPWVVPTDGGKVVDGLYDSPNFVYAAAVSADGQWVAGGANDGSVYLWKAR